MTLRGWRNTVGNLIEFAWLKKACHGLQFIDICVAEAYGFIEFEMSHNIISTVFCQPLMHAYEFALPSPASAGARHRAGWASTMLLLLLLLLLIIIIMIMIIMIIIVIPGARWASTSGSRTPSCG